MNVDRDGRTLAEVGIESLVGEIESIEERAAASQ
ncbi:hypothetical protein QF046_002970 [Microbacterium sp. W4I4]|nr:hypothetical protein [Microbacterium sp. W4I4]